MSVLELIFGRGELNTPPISNRVKPNIKELFLAVLVFLTTEGVDLLIEKDFYFKQNSSVFKFINILFAKSSNETLPSKVFFIGFTIK